jgi:hypothetical protein
MPILGAGATLHFAAMSQALAFFPTSYLSILLVGSYCPFIVYVPVNSVGQLCAAEYQEHASVLGIPCANATRDEGSNAAVILTCNKWEIQWHAVWAFFITAIVLCLQVGPASAAAAASLLQARFARTHKSALGCCRQKENAMSKRGGLSCVLMSADTLTCVRTHVRRHADLYARA